LNLQWASASGGGAASLVSKELVLVLYPKDSSNGFRRLRRRGNSPAKIRKRDEAAPMTISSFSLTAI